MDDGKRMADDKKKKPEDDSSSSDVRHPSTEIGGPKGAEPTRFGDWEINGKCVDF